jgi:hypothetical protein
MTVTWRDVFSSHVNRVGHDDATGEMLVEWKSGKVSAYEGVAAEKVDEISRSYSIGERLKDIKSNHTHRYRE